MKLISSHDRRRFSLFVAFLFFVSLRDVHAQAEDRRWTGGSPDFANWSDTRNWEGNDNPNSDSGSRAFFGNNGSARTTSNDDYGSFHDFGQIIFDATTVSYTLTGSSIKLFSKVEVTGTSSQTFAISSVSLGGGNTGGTTEFNPTNGDLNVTSANIFGDGKTLAISGTKTVTFSGNYQNGTGTSNLTLSMASTGVANFNGASSFSGTTTLNSGTLGIGDDSAIGTSLLRFSGSANVSSVGGARTIGNNVTLSGGSMTFTGSNSLQINGSFTGGDGSNRNVSNTVTAGTLTLAGPVYISANEASPRTLTFGATTGATANVGTTTLVTGTIANNAGTNTTASSIAAQGGGLVILAGDNSYTGTTTLQNGSTQLRVGNGGATGTLGSGDVSLQTGSKLAFNRNNALTVSNNILAGTGSVSQIGSGVTTMTGSAAYTGGTTVSNGSLIVNGNHSAATGAVSVTGSGTLLGGIGTIGGATTINGGSGISGATNGTIGALTLSSSLTFTGTGGNLATYFVDLASGANNSDRLAIGGALSLATTFDRIQFSGTPDGTSSYNLATFASRSGTFDSFNTPSGYQLVYGSTSLDLVPVPEPSTWVGAGLALAVIGYQFVGTRKTQAVLKA